MMLNILFAAGIITLLYGLFRLFNADQFDFSALVPIIVSFGIIGSALFLAIAHWFGASL